MHSCGKASCRLQQSEGPLLVAHQTICLAKGGSRGSAQKPDEDCQACAVVTQLKVWRTSKVCGTDMLTPD